MLKAIALTSLLAIVLTGCAWQTNLLNNKQNLAVDTTLSRARFEMDCPDAAGSVLSRTVIDPYYGAYYTYGGPYYDPRAVYTIGVTGCGKRATYVATCPDGSVGCFAAVGGPYGSSYSYSQLAR